MYGRSEIRLVMQRNDWNFVMERHTESDADTGVINSVKATPTNVQAAEALATPRVQRHEALLLPGGGGRDCHLAHRGRAQVKGRRPAYPGAPRRRQRKRQPRVGAHRAEDGHRRRQDHRNGHAHRLADHQRVPPPQQPTLHTGLPGGGPGYHHQRPAPRPPAQRPRQLLRQQRASTTGHARRPRAGQDSHHQLPRAQATRPHDALSCRAEARNSTR